MTKLEHHPYPSVVRLASSSSTEKIYCSLEFFQKCHRLEKLNKIDAAAESRKIPCESASLNSFLNFHF